MKLKDSLFFEKDKLKHLLARLTNKRKKRCKVSNEENITIDSTEKQNYNE